MLLNTRDVPASHSKTREWYSSRSLHSRSREDSVPATAQNEGKREERKTQAEARPKTGTRTRLRCAWTLTCRIVIEGVRVFLGAVASKEGFVVVILVPVEWLDLQPPTLGVTTHNAGHGLVDLGGGAGAVHVGQKHHLLPHVTPALRAEQLVSGWGEKMGRERERRTEQGLGQERRGKHFIFLTQKLCSRTYCV